MGSTIAVDIGGTQIRIARYPDHTRQPSQQSRISTRSAQTPIIDRIIDQIAHVWPVEGSVDAIGIAAPGPVDTEQGILYAAPNIPGWINVPLRQILQDRFRVPVLVGNDANLAALGEWRYGAGKGHRFLLYLTISTGIGGGVVENGQVLLGVHGLAAELGHTTIDPDGPMCSCGVPGHLEAYASGTAIARDVAAQLVAGARSSLKASPPPTARDIDQAARQGDSLAIQALARAGHYLGFGVASFLHMFNPSIVIFGGGVSLSGDLLFAPMKETLQKSVISAKYLEGLEIANAALGDDAGLLGALALAQASGER